MSKDILKKTLKNLFKARSMSTSSVSGDALPTTNMKRYGYAEGRNIENNRTQTSTDSAKIHKQISQSVR